MSPIAWLDPIQITAVATVVLAFVGVVSIVANFVLAWQARASAITSRDGVALQREELETVRRQLKLAEDQFAAARDAARPRLQAAVVSAGSLYIEGIVSYVHGSEPAYKVRVWIRGQSRPGATWGLYLARVGFINAADRQLPFKALQATAQEQSESPFPEFMNTTIGPREFLIGMTWERLDKVTEKQSFRQHVSLADAPENA